VIALVDEVRSETVKLENAAGRRLFGLFSEPLEAERRGVVVLPPGYERRIHHYAVLSRHLVRHGYATVRFDFTNHIGLSEGEVFDLTMSSMVDDVTSVLAAYREQEPPGALSVVASSLAARATIRALAEGPDDGVQSAVLILPVVDVERTTTEVVGENRVGKWRTGEVTDPTLPNRVLSHDVSYGFAKDVVESGLHDLAGTKDELARIRCPVTALAAERDDWVDVGQVREAMGVDAPGARATVLIEAASHEFSSNAPVVRLLLEQVGDRLATDRGEEPPPVRHLDFDEMVETIRQEKAWKLDSYRTVREVVT